MDLTTLIEKDFVKVEPDTKISEIVGKMINGKDAVAVCNENDFIGIISASDIIDRDYPIETKAKTLARKNIPKIEVDIDFAKAARLFADNNVKAIPFFSEDKLMGLLYEKDFIWASEHIKELGKTLIDIASIPEVINKNENIGKARTIIKENNISRLPVVDEEGKLVGIIDIEDFLKTINPKESIGRNDSVGDSIPESKLPVTTIMNSNPLYTEEDISYSKLIKVLKKHNSSYILITKERKPVGIVTLKDILEFLTSLEKEEGVYVQIAGLGEIENSFDKEKVNNLIEEYVKKIGKISGDIEYFFIHIKSSQKGGEQKFYSIRTRVFTSFGLFVSKSSDWNIITTLDEALGRLERQITDQYEKNK